MSEGGVSGATTRGQIVADTFHFGPYRFEPRERVLYESGREVGLPLRALKVLEHLLRRAGHIVSKDELLGLWEDTAVSEQSLTDAIRLIRREFGDSAEQARYMKLCRRRSAVRALGDTWGKGRPQKCLREAQPRILNSGLVRSSGSQHS